MRDYHVIFLKIVSELNIINIPVIKQIVPFIFVHSPLFIVEMQLLLTKTV